MEVESIYCWKESYLHLAPHVYLWVSWNPLTWRTWIKHRWAWRPITCVHKLAKLQPPACPAALKYQPRSYCFLISFPGWPLSRMVSVVLRSHGFESDSFRRIREILFFLHGLILFRVNYIFSTKLTIFKRLAAIWCIYTIDLSVFFTYLRY